MIFLLSFSIPAVFAGGNDIIENLYFSMKIPDSWAYIEGSNTPEQKTTGYGPANGIALAPNEFSEILLADENNQKTADGGVIAWFFQDTDYRIKNAPLESYVKYVIDKFGIQNITSQQYTTVGKEKSVSIDANESAQFGYAKIVLYLIMHDKEPYQILYLGNPTNYENEKYLTEFEQMVKSFRFVGSPSSEIENLSENENETNTRTNFSSANLTEYTSDNKYPQDQQELYDECVSVAGKSFCDFLFKR